MASGIRLAYLMLVLWQPLWHGWLAPGRWLLGVLLGLVMLLPLTGIWFLRPRAVIAGALLVTGLLVIACMELIAAPGAGALVQALLASLYLALVVWRGRQQQATANTRETP